VTPETARRQGTRRQRAPSARSVADSGRAAPGPTVL